MMKLIQYTLGEASGEDKGGEDQGGEDQGGTDEGTDA
jgi:hypothetical protein